MIAEFVLETVAAQVKSGRPSRISIRDLVRDNASVLSSLYEDRGAQYGVITFRGMPRFLLFPLDPADVASYTLASAPELAWREEAEEALLRGETYPLPPQTAASPAAAGSQHDGAQEPTSARHRKPGRVGRGRLGPG